MQQNIEIFFLLLFFAVYCYTSSKQIFLLKTIAQKIDETRIEKQDEEKDIQMNLNNRLLKLQQENYARKYPRLR